MTPIPTLLALETTKVLVSKNAVSADTWVNAPVDVELAPIGVASIAPPLTSMLEKLADPEDVSVPATVRVLPEPTLRPTLVPLPASANIPSKVSELPLT